MLVAQEFDPVARVGEGQVEAHPVPGDRRIALVPRAVIERMLLLDRSAYPADRRRPR